MAINTTSVYTSKNVEIVSLMTDASISQSKEIIKFFANINTTGKAIIEQVDSNFGYSDGTPIGGIGQGISMTNTTVLQHSPKHISFNFDPLQYSMLTSESIEMIMQRRLLAHWHKIIKMANDEIVRETNKTWYDPDKKANTLLPIANGDSREYYIPQTNTVVTPHTHFFTGQTLANIKLAHQTIVQHFGGSTITLLPTGKASIFTSSELNPVADSRYTQRNSALDVVKQQVSPIGEFKGIFAGVGPAYEVSGLTQIILMSTVAKGLTYYDPIGHVNINLFTGEKLGPSSRTLMNTASVFGGDFTVTNPTALAVVKA